MADLNNMGNVKFIVDPNSLVRYRREDCLGHGEFAECYKIKNVATSEVFACKVISKRDFIKEYGRGTLMREIEIHRTMSHKYIVSMHSYFEDESNIYMILELCSQRTLGYMRMMRLTLTYLEVRYFMRQIVLACKYMHDNKVIHGDLSLNNLFINDYMEIKVGEFGFATRIKYDGEIKQTLRGTPNYTAPEILCRKGYSYEADIWALGCIMYELLVGPAPFKSDSESVTNEKIMNNDYLLPPMLDRSAKQLIRKLLSAKPECRPKAAEILKEDFFRIGYIPFRIPFSCLFRQPHFPRNTTLLEESKRTEMPSASKNRQGSTTDNTFSLSAASAYVTIVTRRLGEANISQDTILKLYLRTLLCRVKSVVKTAAVVNKSKHKNATDPSSVPFVWISKWVDYTDKYGYQLCDNSLGLIFNDTTQLVLLVDDKTLKYVDRNNEELYCSTKNYPRELKKKITLLSYFKAYMIENLENAGENVEPQDCDEMIQVPHLRAWFREKTAITFYLTNGTCQINFLEDHTNLILCPLTGVVSLIDKNMDMTVYTFRLIREHGCSQILASKLLYAKRVIKKIDGSFHDI